MHCILLVIHNFFAYFYGVESVQFQNFGTIKIVLIIGKLKIYVFQHSYVKKKYIWQKHVKINHIEVLCLKVRMVQQKNHEKLNSLQVS